MMTKTLLPDYAKNARGYLKTEEREALFRLAGNVPDDGVILNIGVEYGASLVCLRAGSKVQTRLIGIDIDCSKLIRPEEIDLAVELISGDSGKIVVWSWSTFFDLIFIDGDHGYRGVSLDTQYLNWMRLNGVVMFHDCYDWLETDKPHRKVPGVMQAVDDWTKTIYRDSWIEHDKVGTSRLFQRIK